jgi:poly-gamma-glutamate synthesis protein (capsule biosynthesis protein)
MNLRTITLLVSFLALPSCFCSEAREARISFAGDIIMHIPVKSSAHSHRVVDFKTRDSLNNNGFDFLYYHIKDSLKQSEIAVANMEFPVFPPFESKPKVFNSSPDAIRGMKWAGFNMVTIANNHILDQGNQGVVSTMRFLREDKIDYIGVGTDEAAARAGIVKTVHGIRIGFIGYTGYLNYPRPKKQTEYHLNWLYDREELRQDIENMKKRCDYLIMVVHTGVEYATIPRDRDVELFKSCINWGTDLIIGHHPHLLQPMEKVTAADGRECHIFYSLGNFISNQGNKAASYFDGAPLTTRDSVIVTCILRRSGKNKRPEARFDVVPIYTKNFIEKETNLRVIQTVPISREIQDLKKQLARADGKEKVDIEWQLQNLYQKLKAIRLALYRNKDEQDSEIKEITYMDNSGGYE